MSQDGTITQLVIGTGEGSKVPDGMTTLTPAGVPNIRQQVITPLTALALRFVVTFLVSLVGALPVAAGNGDFRGFVHLFVLGSTTAGSIAIVDLLKNLITIFKGLENKYPLLNA